jgi:hypothetical protein
MIDEGGCGAIGGMKIGRGNRSTWRKPAPMPLCPPQIPHDLTRAAAVGNRRLTAWAMARPSMEFNPNFTSAVDCNVCHKRKLWNSNCCHSALKFTLLPVSPCSVPLYVCSSVPVSWVDLEDGVSLYLQCVSNTAHITVYRLKSRSSISYICPTFPFHQLPHFHYSSYHWNFIV